MKLRHRITLLSAVVLALLLVTGLAMADDGEMFRRNISRTPDTETEEAGIHMMPFYVPAQSAAGELTPVEYYDAEGALLEIRDNAKPLVSIYIDGIELEEEPVFSVSGGGGEFSIAGGAGFGTRDAFAALSLDDGTTWKNYNLSRSADLSSFVLADGHEYPGDAYRMEFAASGNNVLAVWMSRYCTGGTPAYTLVDDLGEPIYPDLFGVAGSQGSVDYTLQGYPEVGEIPYGCVWTARGTLEEDPDTGLYDLVWRKAERLTSGRRDPNVQAVACAAGAGCVMVWQEDPEGLRPGQGLGPGEGWSGAIVNQKTDMWYSFIGWDEFGLVLDADGNLIPYPDYIGDEMPKVGIPMAMPVRVTDNNMCKGVPGNDNDGNLLNPYCYYDFDSGTQYPGPDPNADFCSDTVSWTNPGGTTLSICQTQDGRVLWGRNGASRTRLNLQPYTKADGTKSAWVVMAYEELKALGDIIDPETEEPLDIGKNVWYHTFDMFEPDLVAQGSMLNQPAIDHETGDFFPLLLDEWGFDLYETEIARRFNLMTQSITKTLESESRTAAILIYKQGIINQGGPADIFIRRIVVPETFDPATENPFIFENMVCDAWEYTDGSNPNYLSGVCLDEAINVSGSTITECEGGNDNETCAALFPWEGGTEDFPKVLWWEQTPENLLDQSWANPYDVSKGHRGILDGDFVMMMYAWSPNWKANSVGNDHYNLYIRRSFTGGETWTTTPATLGGDGITELDRHCENYGHGNEVTEDCQEYGPGDFEQAWNVSQLVGNKVTVLDPRYTPTTGSILTDGIYLYEDDERDPSIFFIVYETGDNTTVAEGEAVPLDLFYSRATEYGDKYEWIEYLVDGGTDYRWDWLENKADDLSGEASVTTNPGGTFFYSVWNQWQEPEEHVIAEADIWFRRVFSNDLIDSMPTATILYTSHYAAGYNLGGEITMIGTAKDNDRMGAGIVDYEWYSSIDGVLGNEKTLTMAVNTLSPGLHNIMFSAQDDEGNWSTQKSFYLLVAVNLERTYLPHAPR